MLYADGKNGTYEQMVFPWDKSRLNQHKSFAISLAHMHDESIEYYPILSLGAYASYDELMLEAFPNQIGMQYSNIQNRNYPMNLCCHCGAKQGEHYVFAALNILVQKKIPLDIL